MYTPAFWTRPRTKEDTRQHAIDSLVKELDDFITKKNAMPKQGSTDEDENKLAKRYNNFCNKFLPNKGPLKLEEDRKTYENFVR